MSTTFVDTNVLVYARDSSEPDRQPAARAWIDHLWTTETGRLSTQVLHEYYVTVTRKLSPGLERSVARRDVLDLTAWKPLAIDDRTIERAWSYEDRYELSWWDALIVAAANQLGCDRLLSEDLQDGQLLGAVTVVDPFLHDPS